MRVDSLFTRSPARIAVPQKASLSQILLSLHQSLDHCGPVVPHKPFVFFYERLTLPHLRLKMYSIITNPEELTIGIWAFIIAALLSLMFYIILDNAVPDIYGPRYGDSSEYSIIDLHNTPGRWSGEQDDGLQAVQATQKKHDALAEYRNRGKPGLDSERS
jgi:hypothetical protein